jgi:hypothetical protein
MKERRLLRPLEYGEIFNEAFDLYKRNFLTFVGIGAVVYLPYTVASTLVLESQVRQWLVTMGFAIPLIAAYAALVKAVSDCYLGEPVSIAGSWRYVMRRLLPLMLTWLLVGLLIGLVVLGFTLLFTYVAMVRSAGSVILLSLLGIVSAGLAGFWLAFLPSVMIVEDRFYLGALGRSRALAAGNWGRIFVVGFFTIAVTYGAMFVLIFILAIIIAMRAIAPGGFGGTPNDPGLRPVLLGTQVVTGIMQTLLTPIAALPFVLLYFDVRVRREGYDVELLAREMGSLPPESPPPTSV